MQEKTMTITGRATKSFAPDIIVVSLEHSKLLETYDEALTEVSKRTGEIRKRIVEAGLNGDDLKTTSFSVDTSYESYKDANGNYRKRFVGYRNHAEFEIAFRFDNAMLSNLLGKMMGSEDKIGFSYRLGNLQEAKEEVMALAAKSAIRTANLIAEAASIQLGEIVHIDYSFKELYFHNTNRMILESASGPESDGPEIDMTPQDLTFSDEVTMIFAIK